MKQSCGLGYVAVLLLSAVCAAATGSCSCYTTNSTNSDGSNGSETYTNYTFLDFRSLGGLTKPPPTVNDTQDDGSGNITMPYFNGTSFNNIFAIQNFTKQPAGGNTSTVKLVNSPQNIYISNDPSGSGTYLTLRTTRLPSFQSTAEIDSVVPAQYASLRTRARISGAHGACAGIFYYRNDTDESDIEILTDDPTSVLRASNQPDIGPDGFDVPGASTEASIVVGSNSTNSSWDNWNTYRLDWTPSLSTWYVNGIKITSKTYGVPKAGCNVVLNMWSDGGNWSGNMTEGDTAVMDVQWIEWAWNTTQSSSQTCNGGGSLCNIDKEQEVGNPSPSAAARTTKLAPTWLMATLVGWSLLATAF